MRRRLTVQTMMIVTVLAGLGLSPHAMREAFGSSPSAHYTRYRIVVARGAEADRDLILHLHARQSVPTTGWASVGIESGTLSSHTLVRRGDRLAGEIEAVVDAARYRYRINARVVEGAIEGNFEGNHAIDGAVADIDAPMAGHLRPRPTTRNMSVHLDLPSMYTRFGHMRHPMIDVVVRDGRVTDGAFGSRSSGRRGFTGTVNGGKLTMQGDRLRGHITAAVTEGDAAHGVYTFAVDGRVQCNFVQGRHTVQMKGNDWGVYGFTGTAAGTGSPEKGGVLELTLSDALAGSLPLTLFAPREGDRFGKSLARGGNSATHGVDVSDLKLTDARLKGAVAVSVAADGGFPPGGRSVDCLYELDGSIEEGRLTGRFTGRYGIEHAKRGRVDGRVLAPADMISNPHDGDADRLSAALRGVGNVVADRERTFTPAEADQVGWPSLAGPYGNFQPLRTKSKIIDDLSKVPIAWESETSDLGICKQGTPFGKSFSSGRQIKRYLGPTANRHPGNWAGAIVAEGKAFVSSFRPTGPQMECDFADSVSAEVRVDAEDFVIAIDLDSGHTLWLAAEKGGMLVGGGKRQGFQVAPVYSSGKVFAMGSTGRLFAYDAGTGRKLWQSDIGPAHQAMAKKRQDVLDSLAKRKFAFVQSVAWHTSLTVAEKTLVVPTFSRDGLRGVNVSNGEVLWEVTGVSSHLATPSIWPHGDREYILTATTNGQMRLLDPKDGSVLWKIDGLGGSYFTLSPSSTHVLINVNPKSGKTKEGRVPGFYGAFAITPQKAERVWEMPEKYEYGLPCWMDSEARFRYTTSDGRVYLNTDGFGRENPGQFLILDERTGKIIASHINRGAEADKIGGLWYLIGDKILCRWNNMHGPRHGGRHPWALWSVKNNQIRRLPGTLDRNEFTNGYEVNMEYPIVAGRLLERNEQGRLVCYDLRAQ